MRRLPVARLILLALVILTGIGLFLALSPSTPIVVPPEGAVQEGSPPEGTPQEGSPQVRP